jgi:ATP-dependent Clp protease ATP-binding subunit ClpA
MASPPHPSGAFHRVVQRAIIHVQSRGEERVTGANVLVALFAEGHCDAVLLLREQDITRYDTVNFMAHGIAKTSRDQNIRRN